MEVYATRPVFFKDRLPEFGRFIGLHFLCAHSPPEPVGLASQYRRKSQLSRSDIRTPNEKFLIFKLLEPRAEDLPELGEIATAGIAALPKIGPSRGIGSFSPIRPVDAETWRIPVSLIPIASAVQLLPAAIAVGQVATEALGSFADMLRDAVDREPEKVPASSAPSQPAGSLNWPMEISSLLRDFTSSFRQLLHDHQLAPAEGVPLRLNEVGDVEVAGEHPQRSVIENLLAKTPGLSELFRSLAAQATAHRREQEFQSFQKNPDRPADAFPLLFSKGSAPKFHLVLQGNDAAVAFL